MESYLSRSLGFPRRLSRLYTDTKKASDFADVNARDPAWRLADQDPEVKALHRKLRIQKDRLVTWGLEWSDPAAAAAPGVDEIDESLSRAGLGEIVGSIMCTIKDILAEAEQLWLGFRKKEGRPSERPPAQGKPAPTPASGGDVKTPVAAWDKARFEDLIRDLTTSIDTLFDLSRTRSSAVGRNNPRQESGSRKGAEEQRPFEPSRLQTPRQIDPTTLVVLHTLNSATPHHASRLAASLSAHASTAAPSPRSERHVVSLNRAALAELQGPNRQAQHLLLEFATFDAIYATTGITPPMARFEKLSSALQQGPRRPPEAWTGLPSLLGYFEDFEKARIGLVYRFPPGFHPAIPPEHAARDTAYGGVQTLRDLLVRDAPEPRLEAKFRLAHNLANTLFDLHSRGITHGNLADANVTFGSTAGTAQPGVLDTEIDIRRPLVSCFDLFPETRRLEQASPPDLNIYRHPLDPRAAHGSPLMSSDGRILDLYSLAMVLLQVGLWGSLDALVPNAAVDTLPEHIFERLAVSCGSLYVKAIRVCRGAVDEELAGEHTGDALLCSVQSKVSRYLEACCILDGVTGLEDRLGHDLAGESPVRSLAAAPEAGPSGEAQFREPVPQLMRQGRPFLEPVLAVPAATLEIEKVSQSMPAKMRLYPQIPLPPEAVQLWNTVVMSRINGALRGFYRKNPESVEISLESIGASPLLTRPTVLVVCTSVAKVRSILKKKMGDLFGADSPSGFGLKVCAGSVTRSRKSAEIQRRDSGAAAEGDDVAAANPGYQEVPGNGASIGAWIGDRHLPPVSLGGLIVVDNKAYGMTVHHMLDAPEMSPAPTQVSHWQAISKHPEARSCGGRGGGGERPGVESGEEPGKESGEESGEESADESADESDRYACELSDSASEGYPDTESSSDYDSDDDHEDEETVSEDGEFNEPGDIPGVEPGCGDGYVVTQPAMDDVEDGFYPSPETADEDHLATCALGDVYATSGIRRRIQDGLVHEIDWALFEFRQRRAPQDGPISRSQPSPGTPPKDDRPSWPTGISPTSALPGLEIQCMGRTSGFRTGVIMDAVTSVKIYGRTSPSHTFQVYTTASPSSRRPGAGAATAPALGVPGDSGAWIVERGNGAVCGHVLAFSSKKQVAYICPMDVVLQDIADALCAREVKLPGGPVLVRGEGGKGVRGSTLVDAHGNPNPTRLAGLDERPSTFAPNTDEPHDVSSSDGENEEDGRESPVIPLAIATTHAPGPMGGRRHLCEVSEVGIHSR